MDMDILVEEVYQKIISDTQRSERREISLDDGELLEIVARNSSRLDGEKPHHDGFVSEGRKIKKDCRSGNKNFDEDGKFSTKDDAAVWSGGYEPRGKDCKYGKWSYAGGKTKKMTKHRCGRAKDGTKEKHRCKDGAVVNEDVGVSDTISREELKSIIMLVLREVAAELAGQVVEKKGSKEEKIEKDCNRKGYLSFKDFLLRLDTIERAQRGSLGAGKAGK